jgi:hypothetical protein
LHKIDKFSYFKGNKQNEERVYTMGENLASFLSDKELIPTIYEELKN